MNSIFLNLLEQFDNIIISPFLIWQIMTMLRVGIKLLAGKELDALTKKIGQDIGTDESENSIKNIYEKYTTPTESALSQADGEVRRNTSADNQRVHLSNNPMVSITESAPECVLYIANRMYIMSGYNLNEHFKQTLKYAFGCEVESIDFRQEYSAVHTINAWVKSATQDRIEHILSAGMVGEATHLVIVSAIYFKAQWKHKFESIDTSPQPFYAAGETVTVPMMSATMRVPYADIPELGAKVIELPYRRKDFSMLIILPYDGDLMHLHELMVEQQLQSIKDIAGRLQMRTVEVNMPRFSYDTTVSLKETLQELGVCQIFNGKADFSGIINSSYADFGVSNILQKAYINVTEDGTEAAAITTCCLDGVSRYDEKFLADRPFYFCIKNAHFLKFFEGCCKLPNADA